jgi:hypothetical protein
MSAKSLVSVIRGLSTYLQAAVWSAAFAPRRPVAHRDVG